MHITGGSIYDTQIHIESHLSTYVGLIWLAAMCALTTYDETEQGGRAGGKVATEIGSCSGVYLELVVSGRVRFCNIYQGGGGERGNASWQHLE